LAIAVVVGLESEKLPPYKTHTTIEVHGMIQNIRNISRTQKKSHTQTKPDRGAVSLVPQK